MIERKMFSRFDIGFLGIFNELWSAVKELFNSFLNLIFFIFDNIFCLLIMVFGILYMVHSYTDIFWMGAQAFCRNLF